MQPALSGVDLRLGAIGDQSPGAAGLARLGPAILRDARAFPFFTRVVQEIPAKEAIGLPLPPDPSAFAWVVDGKKGKGGAGAGLSLPKLRDASRRASRIPRTPSGRPRGREDLAPVPGRGPGDRGAASKGETPARVHLERWTASRFELLAATWPPAARRQARKSGSATASRRARPPSICRKALKHRFFAECISQIEVQRALDLRLPARIDIILNGPGKFWPLTREPVTGLAPCSFATPSKSSTGC